MINSLRAVLNGKAEIVGRTRVEPTASKHENDEQTNKQASKQMYKRAHLRFAHPDILAVRVKLEMLVVLDAVHQRRVGESTVVVGALQWQVHRIS